MVQTIWRDEHKKTYNSTGAQDNPALASGVGVGSYRSMVRCLKKFNYTKETLSKVARVIEANYYQVSRFKLKIHHFVSTILSRFVVWHGKVLEHIFVQIAMQFKMSILGSLGAHLTQHFT